MALVARLGGGRIFEAPLDLGDIASRNVFAPARSLSSRMSSTDLSPPSTSMRTERSLVSTRPAGSMAFWPSNAVSMSSAVRPRSARAADETSMNMRSLLQPQEVNLGDARNAQQDIARSSWRKSLSSG